jgi:hypothetical protein
VLTNKALAEFRNRELAWGTLRERPVAEAIARKLYPGSSVVRYKQYSCVDWAVIFEDEIVAGIEIKARRVSRHDFDSTIFPIEKYHAGRYSRRFYEAPTYGAVLFTDGLATLDLGLEPDEEKLIHRSGEPVPVLHALYKHSRLDWHDELFPEVAAKIKEALKALTSQAGPTQ